MAIIISERPVDLEPSENTILLALKGQKVPAGDIKPFPIIKASAMVHAISS
jgi:hypothetical protein